MEHLNLEVSFPNHQLCREVYSRTFAYRYHTAEGENLATLAVYCAWRNQRFLCENEKQMVERIFPDSSSLSLSSPLEPALRKMHLMTLMYLFFWLLVEIELLPFIKTISMWKENLKKTIASMDFLIIILKQTDLRSNYVTISHSNMVSLSR